MKQEKKFDVAALGEILIDFTFQGYDDNGQRLFAQNAGGAPANVLVAIQKLGGKTAFLGKIGDDIHGKFLKETLEKEKVNTDGLIIDNEYFTTLAFVCLSDNGERTFSFARKPGADTKITKTEINTDIIRQTKVFHFGSLSMTDEPSRSTTIYAVNFAKENGCIISYDPNYRANLWTSEEIAKKQMKKLIPFVDVLKISDEETELLTGFSDVKKAAKYLINNGVKILAITLGAKGAFIANKNSGHFVTTFPCKAIDTTGAGDSFWGGFLYKIVKSNTNISDFTQKDLIEFTKFGNAVASLCVERKGAIPAMPTMQEVLKRLNN